MIIIFLIQINLKYVIMIQETIGNKLGHIYEMSKRLIKLVFENSNFIKKIMHEEGFEPSHR